MAPEGIFGIPHGILSSADEGIALGIGFVALVVAVFHDGDRDLQPVSYAAVAGITVALVGSAVAPAAITEEWHIPVIVVLIVTGGAFVAYRRDEQG